MFQRVVAVPGAPREVVGQALLGLAEAYKVDRRFADEEATFRRVEQELGDLPRLRDTARADRAVSQWILRTPPQVGKALAVIRSLKASYDPRSVLGASLLYREAMALEALGRHTEALAAYRRVPDVPMVDPFESAAAALQGVLRCAIAAAQPGAAAEAWDSLSQRYPDHLPPLSRADVLALAGGGTG